MLDELKTKFFETVTRSESLSGIEEMLDLYHQFKVKEIIENNTDIFSAYQYKHTRFLKEINGVSYYAVQEISSEKCAVINSNREIIIPFDYYYHVGLFDINEGNIRYLYDDNGLIYFDLQGNVQEESIELYNKFKSKDVPSNIKKQFDKNKFCEEVINALNNNNIIYNTLSQSDALRHSTILKEKLNFINENLPIVADNTKKMEQSTLKHSIFDYEMSRFFTNGHNKRYFDLMEKSTNKIGIVDFKGDLITPFIYDVCLGFNMTEYIGVQKDEKWGLLDCLGNIIVEPISEDIIEFHDMLGLIKQNKKYGYINTNGEIVIPLIYDEAKDFLFSKALVELNNEKFYINRKGEKI